LEIRLVNLVIASVIMYFPSELMRRSFYCIIAVLSKNRPRGAARK